MIHLERGTSGLESTLTIDPSVGGGLPAWKASGASPSINYLIGFAMVLAGGVDSIVWWKSKALGWNREL